MKNFIFMVTTLLFLSSVSIAEPPPEKGSGKSRGMVVIDLENKKNIRGFVTIDLENKKNIMGFVYIAIAQGKNFELSPQKAIYNLVKAINKHTKIKAMVDVHLYLDDRKIFKVPFVYVSEDNQFELTKNEIIALGEYLRSGGFVLADNGQPHLEYGAAEKSLRDMFKKALGNKAKFLPIANSHPLYHCFYDFEDGPPLGSVDVSKPVNYLEGIWLDNRLVAIYCDRGYGPIWEMESDNEEQLKMGINIVVFSYIQVGSIAPKKDGLPMEFRVRQTEYTLQ